MPKIHLSKREPLDPITIKPYPMICYTMMYESGSALFHFYIAHPIIKFGLYYYNMEENVMYLQDW